MKIRTDFVTNSSSSSFMVLLELNLDNNQTIRLTGSSSNGDCELEGEPVAHYHVDKFNLKPGYGHNESILQQLAQKGIPELDKTLEHMLSNASAAERRLYRLEKNDLFKGASKIVSGRLTLQEYTYGEYWYEADPVELLNDYICKMPVQEPGETFDDLYREMRNDPAMEAYTDRALDSLKEALGQQNDHGNSTVIIQTLKEDQTIDVCVETGDGIDLPLCESEALARKIYKNRVKKYGLDGIDFDRRAYEIAKKYYKLAGNNLQVEFEGKKFYIRHAYEYYHHMKDWAIDKYLGGIMADKLDETVDYFSFDVEQYNISHDFDVLYEDISEAIAVSEKNPHVKLISKENLNAEIEKRLQARKESLLREITDDDAPIVFKGKHFVFAAMPYEKEYIIKAVERKGGIIHKNAVKMADYLVMGDLLWWEDPAPLRGTLAWREKGSAVRIVTDKMVQRVLNDNALLQEMTLRAAEEDKQRAEKLAELQAEKARIAEEEKQRKKEEKKQLKAERKQQAEQEKAEAERQRAQLRKQEAERRIEEVKAEKAQKEAKRQAELEKVRASAEILYAPGEEPEPLRTHIQNFMAKLDEAYPDHVIVNLAKNHTHWDERVTELYRRLGYADRTSFLEAYGFKTNSDKGGRPKTVDPEAVIAELKRRYPDGTDLNTAGLIAANKDLPVKTLSNNATVLFGMGLGKYLKDLGILK